MAPVTDSPRNDALDERELRFGFSTKVSLTPRILFVNIFALAFLAGGFFYLDSYRSRIVDSRVAQATSETRLIADAIGTVSAPERAALALDLARHTGTRVRLFDAHGAQIGDTRAMGLRNFALIDPATEGWRQRSARFLDAVIDTVVGASKPALYREPPPGEMWPDIRTARDTRTTAATVWRAPDRTPVITAAATIPDGGAIMTTVNARDVTKTVRSERYRLGVVLLITTLLSILLSLFLARTIVRPMRQLARAAVRVRLGRAREVVVPRLPERRDEIGHLARALSDMSLALRARLDAIEAFAADVAHEMKNPLASLRSAIEGLSMVKDPELQGRLLAIVRDDVHRLDRLITDIAEASRLDAQLSRAKFDPVDLAAMVGGLIAGREERGVERG
ncbi:MAG: sensor histidine kinase, partial [Pseudomonadota bacterium]|nr:sensor histidine kinase [Pseudomonadota bacterium]